MADTNKKVTKKNVDLEPHNSEAERAVLGSAMLKEEAVIQILSSLREDDFYEGRHQIIYRALQNMYNKKVNVDILTLTEELINIKELENVGGVEYLQQCSDSMVALSSLQFYIDIVNDQSVLRKMLNTFRSIDKEYQEGEIEDINSFILDSETKFKEAIERRKISSFKSVDEVADEVKRQIDKSITRTGDNSEDEDYLIGVNTGYKYLNRMTQGFKQSEFIVLAARPSVGKTALALNIASNVAKYENSTVAIFSLEMDAEMLVKRLVASTSCVNLRSITTGSLTAAQKAKVASAIKEVSNLNLYIDDTPGAKLIDIVAKSKKLQATRKDLSLIVIDYLGLVQYGGKSSARSQDSRQEEVRKISLALKDLARELKIPVLALSQLSRDTEKRDNKRPMLSDLRDSGSIEQDADIVLLMYRPDYYDQTKKKTNKFANKTGAQLDDSEKEDISREQKAKELKDMTPEEASYVEVNVAKNRNGQTGKVGLFFFKQYGRFDSPSDEYVKALHESGFDIDD